MSGETIVVFGTQKTLSSATAAVANNAAPSLAGVAYDIVTDGLGFPDGDFVLGVTFAVAPTEGTVVALYAKPLGIDGINDAVTPEVSRPTVPVGSFIVDNIATVQYILVTARDLPRKAHYYIHNVGTGQSINAGWTLKVTPRSYKAAP